MGSRIKGQSPAENQAERFNGGGNMVDKLMKEIEYAKTCLLPRQALYEVHGQIKMARELKAITHAEYLMLNSACVRDGINNPKYFS